MDQKTFQKLVDETVKETADLLVRKGAEYAGTEDRLSNFKRGATLTGAKPLQVLFIYLSKHYDSLATYVRNEAAGNEQKLSEPITGRLHDIINYCILAKALIMEEALQAGRYTYTEVGLRTPINATDAELLKAFTHNSGDFAEAVQASFRNPEFIKAIADNVAQKLEQNILGNDSLLARLKTDSIRQSELFPEILLQQQVGQLFVNPEWKRVKVTPETHPLNPIDQTTPNKNT